MSNEVDILKRRFNSMLSLCKKSGQLLSGESKCINAIRSNKAKMVILSNDASKNTVKKFSNSSHYYKVPIYILNMSKLELGGVIGDSERSVITVTGDDFMDELKKYLGKFEYRGGGPIV